MNKKILLPILAVIALLSLKIIFNITFKDDSFLRKEAERKVHDFQSNYNKRELKNIFNETCDSFKKATSEDEFLSIMNGKEDVFGQFKYAKLLHSNVINSKVVVLSYRSTYTHYSLIEEFTYRKENTAELCLEGFYIDDSGKRGEVIKL